MPWAVEFRPYGAEKPPIEIFLEILAGIVAKPRRICRLSALGFVPINAADTGLLMGKEPI
jgi:hypothetical protein